MVNIDSVVSDYVSKDGNCKIEFILLKDTTSTDGNKLFNIHTTNLRTGVVSHAVMNFGLYVKLPHETMIDRIISAIRNEQTIRLFKHILRSPERLALYKRDGLSTTFNDVPVIMYYEEAVGEFTALLLSLNPDWQENNKVRTASQFFTYNFDNVVLYVLRTLKLDTYEGVPRLRIVYQFSIKGGPLDKGRLINESVLFDVPEWPTLKTYMEMPRTQELVRAWLAIPESEEGIG